MNNGGFGRHAMPALKHVALKLHSFIPVLIATEKSSKNQSWINFCTFALSTNISSGFRFIRLPLKTMDYVDMEGGGRSYCRADVAAHHLTKLKPV